MTASRLLERETLAALLAVIRREQSACTRDPALLVPQVYPHLWWMAEDDVRQDHFRAICARAARLRTQRSPWLRRRDPPAVAPSLEARFTADAGVISCLAFCGTLLAAGTNTGSLAVWETDSGRADSIAGGDGGVLALAAAPEERLRVCAAAGAGEFDMRARRLEPVLAFDGAMTAAAFSGDLLAAGDALGRIEIWHVASRTRRFVHAGRRVPVARIGWTPDESVLLAIHSSGLITVIDVAAGAARTRVPDGAPITAVLPGNGPRAIQATRRDGSIVTLDGLDLSESPLATLAPESILTAVAVPSGEILAGCESGLVTRLHLANGTAESRGGFMCDGPVHALAVDARRGLIAASTGLDCELHAMERLAARGAADFAAASRPGRAPGLGIVVGGLDGRAHLVPASGPRVRIEGREARFAGPAASAASAPIWAAALGPGQWRAWDVAAGGELGAMGAGGRVTALDVSPDGTLVMTGHDSGYAIAWDTETGAERGRQAVHDGSLEALALHRGRPDLITAGPDQRLRAWRLRAEKAQAGHGEYVAFVTGPAPGALAKVRFEAGWTCQLPSTCRALAFAPDGLVFYGACAGRIIELHPDDGRVLRHFTGPETDWMDVAVSPGGDLLAAAGERGGICLWMRNSGAIAARYELQNTVVGLAWSGGRELAVTTRAGELALLAVEGLPPPAAMVAPAPAWGLQRWESGTEGAGHGGQTQ